jgi:DNA-binding MarR family transcriptional regulator
VSADGDAPHPARGLADIDRVVHEPARLMIVAMLSAVDEADFLYLQRATGLTAGNLSSHLARLEAAGYVVIAKGFLGKVPHTTCRLTDAGQAAFADYRRRMGQALVGGD